MGQTEEAGMFDDRVLMLWFSLVLGLAAVLLVGVAAGSLANAILIGSVVLAVGAWALVH